jgi:Flp pilus assembly protein TadG
MRCRLGGESGQALVELALTIPILTLLLLGAAELARVAYAAIEISNAAEAAVQFATENPSTMNNTGAITLAAQADAYNLRGVTATPTAWHHTCSDGSTPDSNYNCLTGNALTAVTIETSVVFDPLIHLPFLPTTFTLHGYATEQCRSY